MKNVLKFVPAALAAAGAAAAEYLNQPVIAILLGCVAGLCIAAGIAAVTQPRAAKPTSKE